MVHSRNEVQPFKKYGKSYFDVEKWAPRVVEWQESFKRVPCFHNQKKQLRYLNFENKIKLLSPHWPYKTKPPIAQLSNDYVPY